MFWWAIKVTTYLPSGHNLLVSIFWTVQTVSNMVINNKMSLVIQNFLKKTLAFKYPLRYEAIYETGTDNWRLMQVT